MFSATVMSGSTAGCWCTMAMPRWVASAGVSRSMGEPCPVMVPRVGAHRTGRHAHEGGLAGAVLAEQRMHLALADLEGDVGQCRDAVVVLADAAKNHRRLGDQRRAVLDHVHPLCPLMGGFVGRPVRWSGSHRPAHEVIT